MSQRQRTNGRAKNGESKGKPSQRSQRSPGQSPALESPLASKRGPDVIDALFDLEDIPEEVKKLLKQEFGRHMGLSNFNEADINYYKYHYQNTMEMVKASFPPQESLWQGELRKEAGLNDAREALTPELARMIRQAPEDAYSIVARSGPKQGMAQQSLLAEQNQQRRVIEERDVDEGGGFLSKLLG